MLEVGGSGQDDISEFGLALPVAVLHYHELKLRALVHPDPFISIGHGADEGTAVTVDHLDLSAIGSRFRIGKGLELLVQVLTAESFALPFDGRIQNRFRQQ